MTKMSEMIRCELCEEEFDLISHTHLRDRHQGMTLLEYIKEFPDASAHSEGLSKRLSDIRKGTKMGDGNLARREEVREQISAAVKKRWKEGCYNERINGSLGKTGGLTHQWEAEKHTPLYLAEHEYREFLARYQSISGCSLCDKSEATGDKINVHHVDENPNNFLPSNLEPLCVMCHRKFHYANQKRRFVTIGKRMTFASAHRLPDYPGKCSNWHGHEWQIEVCVRKRINPDTGMVMDFKDLKKAISQSIIDPLDHDVVNVYIENPTAENLLVWAWEQLMFKSLLKGIESIRIWEAKDSWAELDKQGMLSIMSDDLAKQEVC